jgi:hypothetical protein
MKPLLDCANFETVLAFPDRKPVSTFPGNAFEALPPLGCPIRVPRKWGINRGAVRIN